MGTATVVLLAVIGLLALTGPSESQLQLGPCTRANMKQPALLGQNIWQCDDSGMFMRLQCHPTSGFCCCVEPRNGKCLKDTSKPPGTGLPQC